MELQEYFILSLLGNFAPISWTKFVRIIFPFHYRMDEAELNHFPNNLLVYGSEFLSPFMIVTSLNVFLFATNKQLRRVTKILLIKKIWPKITGFSGLRKSRQVVQQGVTIRDPAEHFWWGQWGFVRLTNWQKHKPLKVFSISIRDADYTNTWFEKVSIILNSNSF